MSWKTKKCDSILGKEGSVYFKAATGGVWYQTSLPFYAYYDMFLLG